MAYSATNTHLLHESIVLVIERVVVVQVIVALISFLVFAALLGISDAPSLLAVGALSFVLQVIDATFITAVILNWERTSFFITPDEVVVRHGVIEVKEVIYMFSDIDSIELSQDALGKVLNYGSIYFYSQSKKEEIGITNVARPHYYLDIVQEFKKQHMLISPAQPEHKQEI